MATFLANLNSNAREKFVKKGLVADKDRSNGSPQPPNKPRGSKGEIETLSRPEQVEKQRKEAEDKNAGPTVNYHRALRTNGRWATERCQGSEGLQTLHDGNQSNIEWSESQQRYDGVTCAAKYELKALMEDAPTGLFQDRGAIEFFWTTFFSSKPGPIRYKNVRMRVLDKDNTTFASDWTMNVCGGIIMLELWTRQPDNKWLLPEDRFHVKEMHSPPLACTKEEGVAGLLPLYLIKEMSLECKAWLDKLNKSCNVSDFAKYYSNDAILDVDPLGTYCGRQQIQAFWQNLLQKAGGGIISYWNIKVAVIDDVTIHLTADWSLNDVEGQVQMQKWRKTKSGWVIVEDNIIVEDTEFLY